MATAPRPGGILSSAAVSASDSDALEFANALLAFLTAARRTRGRMQPLFDDITVPQLVMLDAIEECGRDGVRAVAELTGVTQPTVTRSATALERDGLARRAASDGDGRRRVLTLTDRGERLLADKRAVVASHLAGGWDGLDSAERALVTPLLRHLSQLVDELF